MKRRVEKYLPSAINAVKDAGIANKEEKVKSQFKGYISSFGASVIHTGLIPSVAFYSVKGSAEEERPKVMKALYKILKANNELSEELDEKDSLLHYVVNSYNKKENMNILTEKIMDAATALKLAIRTYKIEDKKEKK